MMKKRFRLGDIIQKLNEEQANKPSLPNEAVDKKDETQQVEKQATHHQDLSSRVLGSSQRESLQSPGEDLPEQPRVGQKKAGFQVSDFNSQKLNKQIPADKKAIRKDSILHPPDTGLLKAVPVQGENNQNINAVPDEIASKSTDIQSEKANKVETLPERFFDDTEEEEESFDLYKYVEIIFRRKNVVLAVILLMTVFSVFKYMSGPRFFTGFARLLFKPNTQELLKDVSSTQYTGSFEKAFTTHLELLKSQSVLTMVSQNLSRRISPENIRLGLTIKQGETNGQKNDIIELSFKNSNAELAKDVLNELCNTYIDYRRDVNSQEILRFISKLEIQIDKLQKELDVKESDLRFFKEENRMVQLSSETNLTVSKISDMELALQQTQLSLIEVAERIQSINSQISKQELDIVQSFTFNDPFQKKIADLELELNSLTAEYNTEHYKVKMLRQQIENLKAATIDSISRDATSKTFVKNPIRQSLVQEIVNLTVERSALEQKRIAQEKIIERLNHDLLQLPSLEQKYAYLERETESILQTLRMLKNKYEEVKIRRDSQESDLKLLEMAETPRKAVTKVGFANVIIGILIGIVLGIALALLLEYLDQSLKDPRDVERELELPLLGVVPQIETEKVLLEQKGDLAKTVLEPFRALRANLKHIAVQNDIKTFIVCSAIKGEGKTTLSANLSITFSLDSKNVILVDADLRRSQIHSLFGVDKKVGLSDYLLGKATIDEIIKPTMYPHLFIVTSGERPDNPAELLGTYRFDLLLEEIRNKADYIVFDSPALLPVSDTITMAPKIDCCVMVVRTLWTPLKAARQAKSQLKRIGTRIFGGILNGVILSRGYYPYYYGYYGYSSYKYSYEDDHNHKFSFREFGLQFESKMRESLKSIIYKIPRYAGIVSGSIRYVMSRKLFWILTSLFLALAVLLFYIDKKPANPWEDKIQYIGLGGAQNDSSDSTNLSNDMAVPSFSGTQRDSDKVNIEVDTVDLQSSGLSDTIGLWIQSMSKRDIERYLSFYHSKSFRSANENFPEWRRTAMLRFADPSMPNVKLIKIETGKKGVSYIETFVYTINDSGVRKTYDIIWQISAQGWKIVGEKDSQKER
jgi:polysaccharide biosynthesis transport protein